MSAGYVAGSTLANALPTITLQPNETRRVLGRGPAWPFEPAWGLASEDPETVTVWRSERDGLFHVRALRPGRTYVHYGVFPLAQWNPEADVIQRAAWRARARRLLVPVPDEVSYRKMKDPEIWRIIVQSYSSGAMRVYVEDDRLEYWPGTR